MNPYHEILSAAGVSGLLAGLAHCDECDVQIATQDASAFVPEIVSKTPVRQWNVSLYKIAINLAADREQADFVFLGNDLVLQEAFAAIGHRGRIQIIVSSSLTSKQAAQIARNAPRPGSLTVIAPGLVPIISSNAVVLTVGFEGGGGYFLIENDAARALGAIRGQQFTGDVIALLPLGDTPVHERPENWRLVRRDQFSSACRPDGFGAIRPNI